jgi:carbon storage regulator
MLVLSRKTNQSIMIGKDIEVVVLDVQKDQIKLGIRAPKEVSVFRKEIYLEIQEQNRNAAQNAGQISALEKILKD